MRFKYIFHKFVFSKPIRLTYDEKVYWLFIGNFKEVVTTTFYWLLHLSSLIFDVAVMDIIVMDILISGNHFIKGLSAYNIDFININVAFYVKNHDQIRTHFSTGHDGWHVVPCANLWQDWRNHIYCKKNFCEISVMSLQTFVKKISRSGNMRGQ